MQDVAQETAGAVEANKREAQAAASGAISLQITVAKRNAVVDRRGFRLD